MKYFKIIWGYDAEDYVEIDETELEKAQFAHITKKDAIYSGGSLTGSKIIAIQPDYHRIMGWNRGYKLGALDYEELSEKGIDKSCQKFLADKKEKIQYLISTFQQHLIGKNVETPELQKPNPITEDIKKLGDKFKI